MNHYYLFNIIGGPNSWCISTPISIFQSIWVNINYILFSWSWYVVMATKSKVCNLFEFLRQLSNLNYMLAIHKRKHQLKTSKKVKIQHEVTIVRYIYECPSWDEMCWIHLEMKTKVILMYNLHYMTHIVCHTNSLQCQFQKMTKRKSVLRIFFKFQKWC